LRSQLKEFLAHQLAELSEELFVRHYFNALKEAYTSYLNTSLAVNQEHPPAPLGLSLLTKKNEFFTKVDLLSLQVMQHHARETIVKALVEQDIQEVLYWIENNSLQTIGHFMSARYG
jgi:hypothetical protein